MSDAPCAEEPAALPGLHVHAQFCWHEPAHIRGTRTALRNLRDAIDRCLSTGLDSETGAVTADGEAYGVIIQIRSLEDLRTDQLPYTADFAAGRP